MLFVSLAALWLWGASAPIPVEKLDLAPHAAGVQVAPVLSGSIRGLTVERVSLTAPAHHVEPASETHEVVWLVLAGKGTLRTRGRSYPLEADTIVRAPGGWECRLDAGAGQSLHAVRLRIALTADDIAERRKFPQNNTEPWVRRFRDCLPYREAIKSPKTVSRTLLPENYVPRVAIGTVETTGPDVVGAHRHPMLEQLFLGLKDNDITVTADAASANLGSFSILHIPLGSNHGAQVAEGKKLYYIWMDFFLTKEGQKYLDEAHHPIRP